MIFLVIASSFPPEHFWLIVAAYLGGSALISSMAFWASWRFGDSRAWVVGGMLVVGLAAASYHIALLFAGIAAGALLGCSVSLVIARINR